MEETLFYVFGIALVLSAVALSAVGLRSQGFPASRVLLLGLVAYFVGLVGATATFAVLNAREEQRDRDAEQAEAAEAPPAAAEQAAPATGGTTTTTTTEAPKGGGETVHVSSPADGALEYDPSKLTAKAGAVTIDYDNPSPVDHSVAIEAGSKTLAESEIAADTTLTATADLKPGKYVFYCTVPGHREAGMEGTLTVK
jgi:plastocyanin